MNTEPETRDQKKNPETKSNSETKTKDTDRDTNIKPEIKRQRIETRTRRTETKVRDGNQKLFFGVFLKINHSEKRNTSTTLKGKKEKE
jgi:hypothetical protein